MNELVFIGLLVVFVSLWTLVLYWIVSLFHD